MIYNREQINNLVKCYKEITSYLKGDESLFQTFQDLRQSTLFNEVKKLTKLTNCYLFFNQVFILFMKLFLPNILIITIYIKPDNI